MGRPFRVGWENHILPLDRPIKAEELNDFGRSGWECFAVEPPTPNDPTRRYLFRRQSHDLAPVPRVERAPPPLTTTSALKGGLDHGGNGFADLARHRSDLVPVRRR